ncbi:hypothetical protein WJX77_003154 [Trebouxia sp. C0004]
MNAAIQCCSSARPTLARKPVAGVAAVRCPTHRLAPAAKLSTAHVAFLSRSSLPSLRATAAKRAIRPSRVVKVRAAEGAGASVNDTPKVTQARLVLYIVAWYGANIIFNIANKKSLTAFPCPWFISTLQLGVSGLFMCFLWITKLHPVPKVDNKFFKALLVVAAFHTVGHVAACTSFGQMAVSFAHIVKSAEPVFSVALAGPILKETYPYYVWLSLVPIVAGCGLSAMKEVSFAWNGFNNAMLSNVGMVLRNIYSKKALGDYKHIDGINLFGLISIASLLYCAPLAILMEGSLWSSAYNTALTNVGKNELFKQMAVAGIFYHLYNQFSYMVLNQGVSPVTFSVGNTMKRVAVVVSSVLFFRNPVALLNWIGSGVAIFGTFLYSLAKDKAANEAKAASASTA